MTTENPFSPEEGIKHHNRLEHDTTRCAPCALGREIQARKRPPLTLAEIEAIAGRSKGRKI